MARHNAHYINNRQAFSSRQGCNAACMSPAIKFISSKRGLNSGFHFVFLKRREGTHLNGLEAVVWQSLS